VGYACCSRVSVSDKIFNDEAISWNHFTAHSILIRVYHIRHPSHHIMYSNINVLLMYYVVRVCVSVCVCVCVREWGRGGGGGGGVVGGGGMGRRGGLVCVGRRAGVDRRCDTSCHYYVRTQLTMHSAH